MAEIKYVVFSLGDQKYSMKLAEINGIEQSYFIVPVPRGGDCIKGIVHLRNTIIPVYDLKNHFGMEDTPVGENSQLLVTDTKGVKVGFEVDDVIGIISVPDENIKEAPQVVLNDATGYLENIIKVYFAETDTWEIMISIDVNHLISESDMTIIQNVIEESAEE